MPMNTAVFESNARSPSMRLLRKTALLSAGAMAVVLTLATTSARAQAARPDTSRPNLVLIFCDDLAYADIGSFGSRTNPTPNLDRMAAQGVRFTDFYVSSPVCSASRAALLTGCYHERVSIRGAMGPKDRTGLNHDETTLAELLKRQGYATGMAGKWHLGCRPSQLPTHHGFDEYLGLPYSNDMWPRHPEAPAAYPPLPLYEGDRVIDADVAPEDQRGLTAAYTERAVSFIRRNKDRPFFFYLAPNMPHVPLFVSDRFAGKTGHGLYADVIAEIDHAVGEVLRTLRDEGIDERTLVIFTSDNGPWLSYGHHAGSAGRLREGKGTTWEGGVRVPMIARWPGRIPAGKTCDEPAMTIDLLPTFAKIARAKLPELRLDGKDIGPLLRGEPGAKSPQEAYYFYWGEHLQAVRSGNWKLYFPRSYISLSGKEGGRE